MEGIGRDLIECPLCICQEGLKKFMETLVKMAVVPTEILTDHGLNSSARWVFYLLFWQMIAMQYAMYLDIIFSIFCKHYFESIFKSHPA